MEWDQLRIKRSSDFELPLAPLLRIRVVGMMNLRLPVGAGAKQLLTPKRLPKRGARKGDITAA